MWSRLLLHLGISVGGLFLLVALLLLIDAIYQGGKRVVAGWRRLVARKVGAKMTGITEHQLSRAIQEAPAGGGPRPEQRPARQSALGLNAANFFLAEVTGVVMPFLAK